LRILTSRQYEFHYKMAQVAAEYLKAAGFQVELDVVEWATLTKNRTDPALWDIYITHSPFLPEPSLNGIMSDASPGWWVSDRKHQVIGAFNAEADPAKRLALYARCPKGDPRRGSGGQDRRLQRSCRPGATLKGRDAGAVAVLLERLISKANESSRLSRRVRDRHFGRRPVLAGARQGRFDRPRKDRLNADAALDPQQASRHDRRHGAGRHHRLRHRAGDARRPGRCDARPGCTAADIAALRSRLGLDGSILEQFGRYVLGVVQGDFGQSIFLNEPVTTALAQRAEPTFFLTIFSLLIATLIALPVGILAAYKRGSIFDQATTTIACSQPVCRASGWACCSSSSSPFKLGCSTRRLWRSRCSRSQQAEPPCAAGAGARPGQLGADHSLHPRLDARRAQ